MVVLPVPTDSEGTETGFELPNRGKCARNALLGSLIISPISSRVIGSSWVSGLVSLDHT